VLSDEDSSKMNKVSVLAIRRTFAAESARSFRQQNGLLAYAPPNWFLEGYFIAREKEPNYVFGPVKDFVRTIGGTTAWLIEDLGLERLEGAVKLP